MESKVRAAVPQTAPTIDPEIATSLSANALATISFDRSSDDTLYDQLCQQIRRLIDDERLIAGVRLPSSRELSQDLGVSRNTVVNSYDQLTAEGFLESRVGAGTFICKTPFIPQSTPPASYRPMMRAEQFVRKILPLTPSRPDQSNFPRSAWARAAARGQRKLSPDQLFAPAHKGYGPLRHYIAHHLKAMRGLTCDPDQIVITSGLTESLSVIARSLFADLSGAVLVEDPGCQKTHQTLHGHGLSPIAVPVDQGGMRINEGLQLCPDPDAIIVTPSRQYPLGCQLSLARRKQLLDWSERSQGWIIEDDYDCEYRFSERPLSPLYAMDRHKRTLYLGSFSKVLFPQLRISFIVAPADIVPAIETHLQEMGSLASLPAQAALSEFMASGQFATHLRSMRRLYKSRYHHIFRRVSAEFGEWLTSLPIGGGTQFCAYVKPEHASKIDDVPFARTAAGKGIGILPLSRSFTSDAYAQAGFIIGFANTDPQSADDAIEILKDMFEGL